MKKKRKSIKDLPDGHHKATIRSIRLIKKDGKLRYELNFVVDGYYGAHAFYSPAFHPSGGPEIKDLPVEGKFKKHRINRVSVSDGGFHLSSKDGLLYIPVRSRTVSADKLYQLIVSKLRRHLPHYAKTLLEQSGWDDKNLKKLLLGKYMYGRAVEREWKGTFSMDII